MPRHLGVFISRHRLGDALLLAGILILLGAALFWVESALAAQQMTEAQQHYLVSTVGFTLLLPELTPTPGQTQPAPQEPAPQVSPEAGESPLPTPSAAYPTPFLPQEAMPTPAEVEPQPTEPPAPAPPAFSIGDTGRVARLVIPRLGIDRAAVPLGMRPDANGILQWDTDSLFATRNRADLVGHLVASLNPGQGGNVILIGHNYDQGLYVWEGVFVNLKNMQPGDQVIVYTEGGGEYRYTVQLVKKVPWQKQNNAEWEKHLKFLGPSPTERLTLVTCGGANIWPWPARIYVVAVPLAGQ